MKKLLVILVSLIWLAACNLSGTQPSLQQLRIENGGSQDIQDLTVMFPGPTALAATRRIKFGNVAAGQMTGYLDVPGGVYRYASYEYTLDGRLVQQPVVDWVGESPLQGKKFTYRLELDPQKEPGGQIQLIYVLIDEP